MQSDQQIKRKKIIMAKCYAALEFDKLKHACTTAGKKRVRRGAYDTIIQEARVKYDLPAQVKLGKETISLYMKPDHKLCIAHPGPSLPMKKVEGFFLEIILLLGDMQTPATSCREGLELANLLYKEL